MTLNGEMALILRYFTEFGSFRTFRGALRKSTWLTKDNLRLGLPCLVVNVCRGTAGRPLALNRLGDTFGQCDGFRIRHEHTYTSLGLFT